MPSNAYAAGRDISVDSDGVDTSVHPGWKAQPPTNFEYGPADPHSKRSIDFSAMQDPGVHEGVSSTAAEGPTKGSQNQKNT